MTGMAAAIRVRKGPRHWLRSYRVMLRWELTSLRLFIPVTIAVQVLAGAGFAVGIGLLRDLSSQEAMYLATGTAVITLVLVGLILGPQIIAQQKANDTYDFLWSLPVPRTAAAAAWTTMAVLIGLPGMIAAVAVAGWRYHLDFHLGWSLIPAVLLTAGTAALIGYALAHIVGNPMITMSVTQALIFFVIGFSPVTFADERLPRWLDRLHDWLPFKPMATVVRDALSPGLGADVGRAYAVLLAWFVAMVVLNAVVLGRRG
jgi:ABC-2 type transport system permease protein